MLVVICSSGSAHGSDVANLLPSVNLVAGCSAELQVRNDKQQVERGKAWGSTLAGLYKRTQTDCKKFRSE
jgi:hypothetical protein